MIKVIPNVYTHKECQELINSSEIIGYSDVLVNKFNEKFTDTLIRSDQGLTIESDKISNQLLERVGEYIIESSLRVNPLVRFSKYKLDGKVIQHQDATFTKDGYTSKYTVILYLNDANGGETQFKDIKVECKEGQVLLFDQSLIHSALPAKDTKYILRTDILIPSTHSTSHTTEKLQCFD